MPILKLDLYLKVVNVGYQKYQRQLTGIGVPSTDLSMPIKKYLKHGLKRKHVVKYFTLNLSTIHIEGRQMMAPLNDNDIALVVRPNLQAGKWDGTVNLNIVAMPSPDLSAESAEDLLYMVNGLVACFQLMNSDSTFANRVSVYMAKLREENDQAESLTPDNVVQLDQWTKTKGTA